MKKRRSTIENKDEDEEADSNHNTCKQNVANKNGCRENVLSITTVNNKIVITNESREIRDMSKEIPKHVIERPKSNGIATLPALVRIQIVKKDAKNVSSSVKSDKATKDKSSQESSKENAESVTQTVKLTEVNLQDYLKTNNAVIIIPAQVNGPALVPAEIKTGKILIKQ